jgi:hypothetical protein
MSNMMKRFPVSFKDNQHEAIRLLAHKDKKSMADIVRIAVDEYIKKRHKNGKPTS